MTRGKRACPPGARRLRCLAGVLLALLLPALVPALVPLREPGKQPGFCGSGQAGNPGTFLPELSVPEHPEAGSVPPFSPAAPKHRRGVREGWLPGGSPGLVPALGMSGGIEDIDFLLELLGHEAGGEEVALVTKLLGYNRDLEEFPAALVERILAGPAGVDQWPPVLLLDLSLKILCSPTWRKGAGSSAARHAIELVLAEYSGLYAAAGDLLGAVAETVTESEGLAAEDLDGLLRLSESVPGMKGLVLAAAERLKQQDPGWPRKSLQALQESLQSGAPKVMAELAEAAALSQLEPGEALDYIAEKTRAPSGAPAGRLWCLENFRVITARSDEEELDRWIRDSEAGAASRLLVSALSYQRHSRLLESLAFSGSYSWRLQAGAVVKISGYRADEEIAQAVLSLLEAREPGRVDLFVQAAENLLCRSGRGDSWFSPLADGLARSLFLEGDHLALPVRQDLVRVLELYRTAAAPSPGRGRQ